MRKSWFVLSILVLGCSETESIGAVCTLLPCEQGLKVVVPANVTVPYTLTAQVPGQQSVISLTCNNIGCSDTAFLARYVPVQVQVRFEWNGTAVSRLFSPVYVEVSPNGPGCLTCSQAIITF
jgi:hypothetical protein